MDRLIQSSSIMLHFSILPDPRKQRNQLYPLHHIISTAILATLCSIDDYYGMSDWTEDNLDWLPQRDLWCDLNSIVCIAKTKLEKGQTTKETRYFIS